MIVSRPTSPEPPSCWNREPAKPFYVRHGLNQLTGEIEQTVIRMDWAKPGCASWSGVGIGQPTADYPEGTPYPIAFGWAEHCKSCRWLPMEVVV